MKLYQSIANKAALLGLLFTLSYTSSFAQASGQQLFAANCQTCHAINKVVNGPALAGVTERGPWTERAELYKWIKNPAAYIPTSEYTKALQATYGGQIMPSFPQLSTADIDAIIEYVTAPQAELNTGDGLPLEEKTDDSGSAILFGVISLILAIVALILLQVNSNLKKLSDDKEQIMRPDAVPFYRNKIYIALFALVFFVIGGYFVGKGAVNLGRQEGYQPEQPIYYSHKVHAGINQISCLYCHTSAQESKHASIPSISQCMNCHKVINSYEKGPQLYDEEGNEIDGTAEIQKLYRYAGFQPGPGATWDPAKAKPIEWIKIHNLPDHVYFNHAQHVTVGKVACQTCHGNIQEMDEVYQSSSLSMGWCINCHRETKVNFGGGADSSGGNKFYSIYERFHEDIKNGRMDSVTVKDIGGLECQKCHY